MPSLSLIELFVQHAYFAFQVVQVFLVTTLTSAASAALTQVLKDPLSAKDLLADNLPKSSNFYISYILIQCLAAGAASLLRAFDVFRHHVIAKGFDNPRGLFRIWYRERPIHWGAVFPVFTNMGVIGKLPWMVPSTCQLPMLTDNSHQLLLYCTRRAWLCHRRPLLHLCCLQV